MVLWRKNLIPSVIRNFHIIKRMYSVRQTEPVAKTEEVLFEVIHNRGIITLNKPKALNAINTAMVCHILNKLQEWEECVEMVIIKGGEKAFCAGGDIVTITKCGPKNPDIGKAFFRTEYMMNNIIGTYKIPYVALIHGITMGGGFGLSVHGHYRVATETTLFAMPETGIGLFPDVGGTYILPRLKGKLGHYLALTGHRLKGADCVSAGIATHFCKSDDLPTLFDALINMQGRVCLSELDKEVFSKYTEDTSCHVFSLDTKLKQIDEIFSLPTIEDIMCRLKNDGSEWCFGVHETLKKMSPISLKLTKKALENGAMMSLQECLQMENRIAGRIMEATHSRDFYEGVRALLVDKDKKPKWNPSKLEQITDKMLDEYFKPLECGEELVT